MKLKDINKEQLELMSYDEIAELILEESGKKMKINDLFKKVCKVLGLSDADFENKIGDFFEIMSTNKKFTMLENGYWDLRTKHNLKVVIDEDEDDSLPEINEENDLEKEEEADIFYETDDTDDEDEDDLQDLVVIDVDDEEANSL